MSEPSLELPASLRPQPSLVPVLVAGALTSALSLFIVDQAQTRFELNLMGWYINYVLNIGALVVGIAAGSGFGLASLKTSQKITGRGLVVMIAVLVAAWVGATYLQYRRDVPGGVLEDGTPLSFAAWFDLGARAIYFKKDHGPRPESLGVLGYGVRALDLLAFVGGGCLVPIAMRSKPYCDACGVYKKSHLVAQFASGLKPKLIGNKSAEREEQRAQLADAAGKALQAILAAGARDAAALRAAAQVQPPLTPVKSAQGYESSVAVTLIHCPSCREAELVATETQVDGRNTRTLARGAAPVTTAVLDGFLGA